MRSHPNRNEKLLSTIHIFTDAYVNTANLCFHCVYSPLTHIFV